MTNIIQSISQPLGNKYNTSELQKYKDNMAEMKRCMTLMGYDMSVITDTSIAYCELASSTLPSALRNKFNTIDSKIYQFENIDFHTNYYLGSLYVWSVRPIDIKEQFRRWARWNNKMRSIISHEDCTEGTQPLCDDSRELTTDINGDIIYVEAE